MATHEVQITLTGTFTIDDNRLSDYQATTIEDALKNQMSWLVDEGEVVQFVADTIENSKLTLKVGDFETSSDL